MTARADEESGGGGGGLASVSCCFCPPEQTSKESGYVRSTEIPEIGNGFEESYEEPLTLDLPAAETHSDPDALVQVKLEGEREQQTPIPSSSTPLPWYDEFGSTLLIGMFTFSAAFVMIWVMITQGR